MFKNLFSAKKTTEAQVWALADTADLKLAVVQCREAGMSWEWILSLQSGLRRQNAH